MIISSRLKRILQICLLSDGFVTVDELANKLQISRRTIFRELSDAPLYLQSYSLHLNSKSKKGICIEGEVAQKQVLANDLNVHKVDYVNKEERRNLLIFEILREKDIQKLYYYANQFQVSESTISNDLDEIEHWFAKFHLTIVRRPGLGISLQGKESDYRRALMRIISKSIQENEGYEKINPQDALYLLEKVFLNDQDGIMKLLNQNILKRVLYVFDEHHHELGLDKYAQSSYIGLIIHLTIMIERTLQAESMEENDEIITMMKQTQSFEQAKVMATYIEKEFDIRIPEAEIAFIAMHIQGAKLNAIHEETMVSIVKEEELQKIVNQMVAFFDEQLPYHLYLDDELYQGLLVHLKPALVRMQYHMNIYNPLLTQIKKDYEEVFYYTKKACEQALVIQETSIPEDEIGFIAMHFGAAIERANRALYQMRAIKVGIVCSSGIGVSALLLARIRKIVDNNVELQTFSVEEAKRNATNCELFISTFEINVQQTTIVVNPLLDIEDVKMIKTAIERLRKKVVVYPTNEQASLPLSSISDDVFTLLEKFKLIMCESSISKDAMLHTIASYFACTEEDESTIYEALLTREKQCSCVYPSFHFAIFHANLECISTCEFVLLKSEGGFTQELADLHFVIAMFMPKQSTSLQKEMMSYINQSVLENENLYLAFKDGDEKTIHFALEAIMKDFLFGLMKESRGK